MYYHSSGSGNGGVGDNGNDLEPEKDPGRTHAWCPQTQLAKSAPYLHSQANRRYAKYRYIHMNEDGISRFSVDSIQVGADDTGTMA